MQYTTTVSSFFVISFFIFCELIHQRYIFLPLPFYILQIHIKTIIYRCFSSTQKSFTRWNPVFINITLYIFLYYQRKISIRVFFFNLTTWFLYVFMLLHTYTLKIPLLLCVVLILARIFSFKLKDWWVSKLGVY